MGISPYHLQKKVTCQIKPIKTPCTFTVEDIGFCFEGANKTNVTLNFSTA